MFPLRVFRSGNFLKQITFRSSFINTGEAAHCKRFSGFSGHPPICWHKDGAGGSLQLILLMAPLQKGPLGWWMSTSFTWVERILYHSFFHYAHCYRNTVLFWSSDFIFQKLRWTPNVISEVIQKVENKKKGLVLSSFNPFFTFSISLKSLISFIRNSGDPKCDIRNDSESWNKKKGRRHWSEKGLSYFNPFFTFSISFKSLIKEFLFDFDGCVVVVVGC